MTKTTFPTALIADKTKFYLLRQLNDYGRKGKPKLKLKVYLLVDAEQNRKQMEFHRLPLR